MIRDNPTVPDSLAADVARALVERARSRSVGVASAGVEPPAPSRPPPAPVEGASAPFDEVATRKHVEILTTILQAFTLRARAVARENVSAIRSAQSGPQSEPRSEAEQRLGDAAIRVHALLVEHPVATRALVSALAAEGRQFAATPEGSRLRERLLRSRLVRRGALLWNSLTMGLIDGGEPSALPSAYVDVLVELSERVDLEKILGDLSTRVDE